MIKAGSVDHALLVVTFSSAAIIDILLISSLPTHTYFAAFVFIAMVLMVLLLPTTLLPWICSNLEEEAAD